MRVYKRRDGRNGAQRASLLQPARRLDRRTPRHRRAAGAQPPRAGGYRDWVRALLQPGSGVRRRTFQANAERLDESKLLLFPTDDLHRIVQRNPMLGLVLLRDLTSFMRKLVNLVDDLALHSVQGRLARLLLRMADDLATGSQLTQGEMAAQLGTVREMVGRSLKSFETLGLIKLERGLIQVVNREGLMAQAED